MDEDDDDDVDVDVLSSEQQQRQQQDEEEDERAQKFACKKINDNDDKMITKIATGNKV